MGVAEGDWGGGGGWFTTPHSSTNSWSNWTPFAQSSSLYADGFCVIVGQVLAPAEDD